MPEKTAPEPVVDGPIRYPDVEVELSDMDGNPASIIGRTMKALRRAGVPDAEVSAFTTEARSGDFDNVLQTVMRWVETS
jgi:hypothetical protein